MNKLTIKELAPYLPYRLKVNFYNILGNYIKSGIVAPSYAVSYPSQIKPHLRPLSDLTQKEEWKRRLLSFLSDGRSDNFCQEIVIKTKESHSTFKISMYTYRGLNNSELLEYTVYKNLDKSMTKYGLIEWAIENHFDVFGLIDKGLAIAIEEIDV